MTNRNLVLVTGATGAQGGSVARHLLKGGEFRVRALTRHPESAKAAALKDAGAEVVQGDLGDLPSLRAAVQGCYSVFGVTNYWEHFNQEYQQGKNLVDAVKEAEVEHFVFSSLPHVHKLTNGALEVPHFDRKAEIEEYARTVRPGSIFVHVAFYYENFLTSFPLQDQGNGAFGFGFPQGDRPLAGVAVEDVGGVVAALFAHSLQFRDKVVRIVGDDLPPAKMAEIMTHTLGKKVVYNHIPREVFAAFGFPGADDLANMFEYNRLYIPSSQAEVAQSRALYPAMQSFEAWLRAHQDEFHLQPAAALGTAG